MLPAAKLFSLQARAVTQQARSPVIRINAANPDQITSDSTADSASPVVTSEAHSSANGNGHLSPQNSTEGNGCVASLFDALTDDVVIAMPHTTARLL